MQVRVNLRGNLKTQIQSLESYQSDDLPAVENSVLTSYRDLFWLGKHREIQPVFCAKLRRKIGHSGKFVLHEIRPKMRITANHGLTLTQHRFETQNKFAGHYPDE